MRHSKSCCNHIRHDSNVQNIPLSQEIRDPSLSVEGHRVATMYGPNIRSCLKKAGFDVDNALIASSMLKRAQETATLIFNRVPRTIDFFTENGAIPENTPADTTYRKPDWKQFIQQLAPLTKDGASVAVVGHGSYLGSLWPALTGKARDSRLNNLDGILLDIEVGATGLTKVYGHRELRCRMKPADHGDQCTVADTRKITALSKRMTRYSKKGWGTRKANQRGGFASMPLGFHQAGAQFAGTTSYPTGTQTVFPTEGAYVRAPLVQSQAGGFSPAIMGSFVANGARLVPIAGYMGYRMLSNQKKTRKRKAKKRHRG